MEKPKALIIDDDAVWCRNLTTLFSSSGFQARSALSCADGLALAGSWRPDCVLLDFYLKDGDGGSLCLAMRASPELGRVPVIMISGDPAEELNAYTSYKADGFILKGARFDKILAVVHTILRRVGMERGALTNGDISLEPGVCRLLRRGHAPLQLPPEQFRLLHLLVGRAPVPVSEAEICSAVMGAEYAGERAEAVYSLVYRLRRTLGPQLALRVKNLSSRGWAYVSPRERS
jgi:DNA-binding response OmpR family regulator